MTRRQTNELRGLGVDELDRRLMDAKHELFNLRFQLATRSLQNYSRMDEVRRQIARINTLRRERELGIER